MNAYFVVTMINGRLQWCVTRFIPSVYSNFLRGDKVVHYEEFPSSFSAYAKADSFASLTESDQLNYVQERNSELTDLVPALKVMHVVAGYCAIGVSDQFAEQLYAVMCELLEKDIELTIEEAERIALGKVFRDDDDHSGGVRSPLPGPPNPPRHFGDFKQFPCFNSN